MRIIVCGGRQYTDRSVIAGVLAAYDVAGAKPVLVHGGARGTDRIAAEAAEKLGWTVEPHRPDYGRYGSRTAPLRRNEHMAWLGADVCICFPGDNGTDHMGREAEKHGISVVRVCDDGSSVQQPTLW